MDCPSCGASMVAFDVPLEYREYVPESSAQAALCPACLTLTAATTTPEEPRFDRISDAFPTGEAAVPMAIAVGLLDSLALHRAALEELLVAAERGGVDPLLVLDRLHAQGGVQPDFDLDRRRHQLEQLLE
ncbi:DUF6276 family protein [Natronomonas marina]|jgi:hypothetical protein|uniref:DUF6276 family protein n=1 Tax=Natronomonas marina TaxID=2961939 RepID=UPI0020C98733|nr:DUF6276 family protein [Natronomonas marina]